VESAFKQLTITEVMNVIKIRDRQYNESEGLSDFTFESNKGEGVYVNPNIHEVNHLIDAIVSAKSIRVMGCKSNIMDVDSMFMVSAYKIINNPNLLDKEKEICIEILGLYYENNFVEEVIKSIGTDDSSNSRSYQLIISLFNQSYRSLSSRIDTLIRKYTTKKFLAQLSSKSSASDDGSSNIGRRVKLMVILNCLGVDRVSNIVFNVVVKLCGITGGAEEMDLINNISNSLIDHMRNVREKDLGHLSLELRSYYLRNKDAILIVSSSDQVEIGQGLLDLMLDSYDMMFIKRSELRNGSHRVNYVFIQEEYVAFMANFVFNPMRLPMLCPPKI
jgi:hypothetical protein